MSQYSTIEWTDHTFNPWWGCTKVSPGCTYCYAEIWAKRYGHELWGQGKSRRFFGDTHWNQPLKWNKQATEQNLRARVFCASMADVFEENKLLDNSRERLWDLIEQTPMLDWLLLTKRPENMLSIAPWKRQWPDNVWAMATVENQKVAEKRILHLLEVPAIVKGLSIEPMLGPIQLDEWIREIQWIIVGGESGGKSRPMNPNWVRVIRDLCLDENVSFFFKQWGNWVPTRNKEQGTVLELQSFNGKWDSLHMKRVAKKQAGYEIDGQEWKQLPNRA